MGHATKFEKLHRPADAPAGHHLPHAATMPASMSNSSSLSSSPTMDAKHHKHFHSHVSTPYPVLEHSSTMISTDSGSSTGSNDYMQTHKEHHRIPSITNPVHSVQDHVSEFRYGHMSRSAKREAAKKSSSHPWNLDAAMARKVSEQIDERYEEVVEDWKEKDEQAWAEELRKREAARTSGRGWSTTKIAEESA